MDRGAFIHTQDTEGLQPAIALKHFADHSGTLIGCLITVAAQDRHMQENIRHTIIRDYETIAFRCVKPFDLASNDDNLDAGLFMLGRFPER